MIICAYLKKGVLSVCNEQIVCTVIQMNVTSPWLWASQGSLCSSSQDFYTWGTYWYSLYSCLIRGWSHQALITPTPSFRLGQGYMFNLEECSMFSTKVRWKAIPESLMLECSASKCKHSCDDLDAEGDGREVQEGGNIWIHTADSLPCTAKASATF